MSRANQFSTHKSMSIRETEDGISNMKSVRKIIETDMDGNSPNTQHNFTVTHQMNRNITESPYKDTGTERRGSGAIKVQEEVIESPARLSNAMSSNASSVAPLLFVDVNLGPEH